MKWRGGEEREERRGEERGGEGRRGEERRGEERGGPGGACVFIHDFNER